MSRTPKAAPAIDRGDSDDELGTEDHPWEWIYGRDEQDGDDDDASSYDDTDGVPDGHGSGDGSGDDHNNRNVPASSRKRKRSAATPAAAADPASGGMRGRKRVRRKSPRASKIVGARMGDFACRLGDTVLLRAENSGEAWVGIICEFGSDENGDKAANFMWFSTEKEIRNREKKRKDVAWNELYITPSWDWNPVTSINGRASIMSMRAFQSRYPNGKVPRRAPEHGKVFVCRRGCNTRTATYTDEFVWEDVYHSADDIDMLVSLIKLGTKATRSKRSMASGPPERDYAAEDDGHGHDQHDDEYDEYGLQATDDEQDPEAKPPRTPRHRKKALRETAVTPSSTRRKGSAVTPSLTGRRRVTVKKQLEFTPLATRVLDLSQVAASPYQVARTRLHVAAVPESLPCREAEFQLVYSHLEAAITDGTGTCIYISGTPGTGKTATVREVVSHLDAAVRADELDDFVFVEINGMRLADPHQAYALLWEALRGQRVSPSQALDLLTREFSTPSPRRVPCVVLMDELDQLVTRNQAVMYNFFNWPGLRHSRLIVLAVANTMDLPERTLSNKISSRLGLTRITFPGYTHEQLMRIVQSRLAGVPGDVVDPDAVQFAARKVAAVSGDARRALDICRRAVELAEAEAAEAAASGTAGDGKGAAAFFPTTPSKRGRRAAATVLEEEEEEEEVVAMARVRGKHGSSSNKTVATTPAAKKRRAQGRVTIDTVRRAIAEATSNPLQLYLRALPLASRLLLAALVLRAQRSGVGESTFGDVVDEAGRALRMVGGGADDRPASLLLRRCDLSSAAGQGLGAGGRFKREHTSKHVRPAGLGIAAVDLTGSGIVYLEAQRAERPSKIRLAISDEKVRLAFRDDPEIKAIGLTL